MYKVAHKTRIALRAQLCFLTTTVRAQGVQRTKNEVLVILALERIIGSVLILLFETLIAISS